MMRVFSFLLLGLCLMVTQGCATMKDYVAPRGNVPIAADEITEQLDRQIIARFTSSATEELSNKEQEEFIRQLRSQITIMGTVPVNVNDLEVTCPLGRQMMEEVSRGLMARGYKFKELRKGKNIYFKQREGEMVLTRNTRLLERRNVSSQAILAGTYVVSPVQVRFSMRLLHTPGNDVLAIGTATVPITEDVPPLLVNTNSGPVKVTPSVSTRLR